MVPVHKLNAQTQTEINPFRGLFDLSFKVSRICLVRRQPRDELRFERTGMTDVHGMSKKG